MTFDERIECLEEAWENAKKTTHDYLTTMEKTEVDRLIMLIEDIRDEVE